jgi:hypothetical protein
VKIKPTSEFVDEQGPVLEEDLYDARLKGFGEYEGQFGARLVWQFIVEAGEDAVENADEIPPNADGEYEVAAFSSYSAANTEKKQSNLIKWSKAILGELPEEYDLDDLLGKPCRVAVEQYEKEGIKKNVVKDVKPPKKRGGKTAMVSDKNEQDFEDIPF